jgi:hypothetical protein
MECIGRHSFRRDRGAGSVIDPSAIISFGGNLWLVPCQGLGKEMELGPRFGQSLALRSLITYAVNGAEWRSRPRTRATLSDL